MLKKRIIPCLDVKNGRTVKGVNFVDLIDAGDPVEQARFYAENGADELVFLDISATLESRATLIDLVEKIAATINIPFTVGGGINSVAEGKALVSAGADKISINSAAVRNPNLIKELSAHLGSQCVVVAIDAKKTENGYKVFTHGGTKETDLKALDWARSIEQLGAGEILLTAMDADGTKKGFNVEITRAIADLVSIPVIASGGAGSMAHFKEVFEQTKASAALAASLFHFNELSIPDLKNYLVLEGIETRVWK